MTVALASGVVKLPWESRQALLAYRRRFEDARPIVEAFADSGNEPAGQAAGRPESDAARARGGWTDELRGNSSDDLAGVWELRNVLHDDLDERLH